MNNQQLGQTISCLRKGRGLTQKQLGDRLFVTDKTVSKWERGVSMPNIFLIAPLAEALGVSTDELLTGVCFRPEQQIRSNKRFWAVLFFLSVLLCAFEFFLLFRRGFSLQQLKDDCLLISVMTLAFGCAFCFFVKPVLPNYYDTNRIGYYSNGFMRLNLPGISLNNSNWFYICRYFKSATLGIALIYPLLALICGVELWLRLGSGPLFLVLGGLLAGVYIVAYRHK